MPQTYQAPVGAGVGVQKFSIKPGGLGLDLVGSSPAPSPAAPGGNPESAPTPALLSEPTPPPTPFERLYPGVDPTKVEMELDGKSNRIRFKPIQTEAPPETPTTPTEPPRPASGVALSAPESDPVARLQAQLDQQSQIMTAMVMAAASGRPLGEVLGLQAAQAPEPDYSGLDLYDDAQRAQFIKQLRADALQTAKAEVEAQMRGHLPQIQGAQRYGEIASVAAKYGKDPDFERKAALTETLVNGNPNISFEATYKLVSQIQEGLSNLPATAKGAEPVAAPEAKTVMLTPAQQQAKAAQAARYQSTPGGRANGPPTPPPEVARNFKKLAAWVAHQQALGNLP